MIQKQFPEIAPVFERIEDESNQLFYGNISRKIMYKILPPEVFSADDVIEQMHDFEQLLPYVVKTNPKQAPTDISFYAILRHRTGAFKFFYEMLTNWLIPGKQLRVVLLLAHDFTIPSFSSAIYSLCEVIIHAEDQAELEQIENNFPTLHSELCLGLESKYHSRRILEVRGLSADSKMSMIQEHIIHIIKKLPETVDYDVLREMQHVLVMCRDEFKAARTTRHLSRMIIAQYLFRRAAKQALMKNEDKKYSILKMFRTTIEGHRPVLAISAGVTFTEEKEVLDERMFINAIQTFLPYVNPVSKSYFMSRRTGEKFATLYIEVERGDGQKFTSQEIGTLRRELPSELRAQIGCMMHPVFMPRNEEEIMRNILSLSTQIKFLRDITQVFITFDEQTPSELFFTVILVRVVSPGSQSIQALFAKQPTSLDYIHDRCKSLGLLRRKYAKEATVFRVKLAKEPFIRRDLSIDLYKARQMVVMELVQIIGEFRDFNGGMISKQNELLDEVKALLTANPSYNEVLLENFFFSLTPVIMRTVLSADALAELYNLLMYSVRSPESNAQFLETEECLYAIVRSHCKEVRDAIAHELEKLVIHPTEEARSYLFVEDTHFFGYFYKNEEFHKRQEYRRIIEAVVCNSHELSELS
jgi:hypothetical protein